MPTDPRPVSVFDVVRRAVEAVDPDGTNARLGSLLERFEDDDEPVRGVDQLDEILADADLDVDLEGDDPDVDLAIATVRYLAHHRGAVGMDGERLLHEAALWQWRGKLPSWTREALSDHGATP